MTQEQAESAIKGILYEKYMAPLRQLVNHAAIPDVINLLTKAIVYDKDIKKLVETIDV